MPTLLSKPQTKVFKRCAPPPKKKLFVSGNDQNEVRWPKWPLKDLFASQRLHKVSDLMHFGLGHNAITLGQRTRKRQCVCLATAKQQLFLCLAWAPSRIAGSIPVDSSCNQLRRSVLSSGAHELCAAKGFNIASTD